MLYRYLIDAHNIPSGNSGYKNYYVFSRTGERLKQQGSIITSELQTTMNFRSNAVTSLTVLAIKGNENGWVLELRSSGPHREAGKVGAYPTSRLGCVVVNANWTWCPKKILDFLPTTTSFLVILISVQDYDPPVGQATKLSVTSCCSFSLPSLICKFNPRLTLNKFISTLLFGTGNSRFIAIIHSNSWVIRENWKTSHIYYSSALVLF